MIFSHFLCFFLTSDESLFLAKKIVKLAIIRIRIFTSTFICCVGGGGILASCGFENWLIFDRLRVRYLLEHTILHKAYNFYLLFCCKCQYSRVGTFPRKFLQFRIFTRGEICSPFLQYRRNENKFSQKTTSKHFHHNSGPVATATNIKYISNNAIDAAGR